MIVGWLARRRVCAPAAGPGAWPRTRAAMLAAVLLASASAAGCTAAEPSERPWRGGVLAIGTGAAGDVYYQVGAGYADAISVGVAGYEGLVAPTAGAEDNLRRLVDGDVSLALAPADLAADAVRGTGVFSTSAASRPAIRALAVVYRDYAHLIVRVGAGIDDFADLRGKRVGTGPPNSGTELVATRLLRAVGIDPDEDIERSDASLRAATDALARGDLDAVFWTARATPRGLTQALGAARDNARLLPIEGLQSRLEQDYPGTYVSASIPPEATGLPEQVPKVAVNNLIVVDQTMPEALAHDLTALVFERQRELATVSPEWAAVERGAAAQTGAVPLHPGAVRYFQSR